MVKVATSTNDSDYTTHAEYSYYNTTGALKRTTIAGGIQEIDYVYNLAGQLKSINHPSLAKDPNINPHGRDLFGLTLDYYNQDYKRNSNFTFNDQLTVENQYSGNIKAMTWNSKQNKAEQHDPVLYEYEYDERNFLKKANFNGLNAEQRSYPSTIVLAEDLFVTKHAKATNAITLKPGFQVLGTKSVTFSAKIVADNANGQYQSEDYDVNNLTYDANGNIKSLKRNKNTEQGSNLMDNLIYHYKADKPNQLKRVEDRVVTDTHANDIKTQTTTDNYKYNSIGQLTDNIDEHVRYEYNASGLVTKVFYNNKLRVHFYYNDKGFRTKKLSYKNDGTKDKTTDYVLDASGSVMAIYEDQQLKELPIYGASRLGMYNKASVTSVYQLTDHLGNVRAVIAKNGNQAIAATTTDYYPFGMPMPNRQIINGEPYRYAYQGQEKDPETGKEAFQLRLWDARIGRWLTTDPKSEFSSPYLGMGNNPLNKVDPDGGSTAPPGEYELDANGNRVKVSNLGDDIGIDFIHQKDNSTIIEDQITKMQVSISATRDGRSLIKDFVNRNQNITALDIFEEFRFGLGPANSLFYGKHPMNLDIMDSYDFKQLMINYKRLTGLKHKSSGSNKFGLMGAIRAGSNLTAQMIGKMDASFYPLGGRVVVLVTDSKSRNSYQPWLKLGNLWKDGEFGNHDRNTPWRHNNMSTTRQSYLFVLPNSSFNRHSACDRCNSFR